MLFANILIFTSSSSDDSSSDSEEEVSPAVGNTFICIFTNERKISNTSFNLSIPSSFHIVHAWKFYIDFCSLDKIQSKLCFYESLQILVVNFNLFSIPLVWMVKKLCENDWLPVVKLKINFVFAYFSNILSKNFKILVV